MKEATCGTEMKGAFTRHLPEKGYQRILVLLLYGGLAIGGLYLFLRFLWKPILPFLIGGLVAHALQRPLGALTRKSAKPRVWRRIWAVVLVLLTIGAAVTLFLLIGNALMDEGRALLTLLYENLGRISDAVSLFLLDARSFITSLPGDFGARSHGDGILFRIMDSADTILIGMLQSAAEAVTGSLPGIFAALVSALPGIFLFWAVTVIAAIYFTVDYPVIGAFLATRCPRKLACAVKTLKTSLFSTVFLYLRAYTLIILLTFAQLYIGFLILKVPYALGLAALIALIDILPVLGTGTVLLPWAAFALATKNASLGVGLPVLYGIISVVRQVSEPKIVGKSIGIHPLAALFAMYCGGKLMGITGLFLFPMTLSVGWKIYASRQETSPVTQTVVGGGIGVQKQTRVRTGMSTPGGGRA